MHATRRLFMSSISNGERGEKRGRNFRLQCHITFDNEIPPSSKFQASA